MLWMEVSDNLILLSVMSVNFTRPFRKTGMTFHKQHWQPLWLCLTFDLPVIISNMVILGFFMMSILLLRWLVLEQVLSLPMLKKNEVNFMQYYRLCLCFCSVQVMYCLIRCNWGRLGWLNSICHTVLKKELGNWKHLCRFTVGCVGCLKSAGQLPSSWTYVEIIS